MMTTIILVACVLLIAAIVPYVRKFSNAYPYLRGYSKVWKSASLPDKIKLKKNIQMLSSGERCAIRLRFISLNIEITLLDIISPHSWTEEEDITAVKRYIRHYNIAAIPELTAVGTQWSLLGIDRLNAIIEVMPGYDIPTKAYNLIQLLDLDLSDDLDDIPSELLIYINEECFITLSYCGECIKKYDRPLLDDQYLPVLVCTPYIEPTSLVKEGN